MTGRRDVDQRLTQWLVAERPLRAPDDLFAAVARDVVTTRRRPGWRVADRWIWHDQGRVAAAMPRLVLVAAVAALLAALAGAAILIGSARPSPAPPLGLARPGYVTFDTPEGVVVSRIDGSDRRVLVAAPQGGQVINPTWSRDGLLLAVWERAAAGEPWDLVVYSADLRDRVVVATGITLRRREADLLQPSNLTWSPDGSRIAFAADIAGDRIGILVTPVDEPSPTLVTSPDLDGIDPSWSPDGSVIAFQSEWDHRLHIVRPDGTGERALADISFTSLWADWSPDGSKIAVQAHADGNNLDIWVISADGRSATNVSNDPADEYGPTWSPDGSRLAWARDVDDALATAWVVTADSDGANQRVIRAPADFAPPIWSPDQSRLFSYVVGDSGIFESITILDPTGLAPPVLVPSHGNLGNGSWQRRP